ncbi:MAG: T9SS type A sorting domain-containing protein [Bacteroidetes bacterium]|nr:T9SS type A sorting domain-containing protein [Bacteroidota bacterium]
MSVDFANDGFWSLAGDPANPTINTIPQFTGFLGANELLNSDPVEGQVYYFYIQDNVGIAEQAVAEITAYPNPAQDYVFVQSHQDDVISIYDLNGKLVLTDTIKKGTHPVSMSHLTEGVYILKSQANPMVAKRIVKR